MAKSVLHRASQGPIQIEKWPLGGLFVVPLVSYQHGASYGKIYSLPHFILPEALIKIKAIFFFPQSNSVQYFRPWGKVCRKEEWARVLELPFAEIRK